MVYEISTPPNYLFACLILIILSYLFLQDINNNEKSARYCSPTLHILTMSSSQQCSEVGTIIISFGSHLSGATQLKTCSRDLNLGFVNPETSYIISAVIEIVRKG